MPDDAVPAHVPTEEEVLDGPGGFDFDLWRKRVAAGKYDGHEVKMAQALSRRAVARNTRRWEIRWQGHIVTEDDYTLSACSHAQKYAGVVWGAMVGAARIDPEWDIEVTLALLYGMARTALDMDDEAARQAIGELTGPEVRKILRYRDGEERPKAVSDQSTTT